jgi:hypothetical protein
VIESASNGLITGTFITDALTPPAASVSAALIADDSIMPLAMTAKSVPSMSVCAVVSENSWSSSKMTGISPRLSRR